METCNLEEAAAFLHMSVSSLRQKARAGIILGAKPSKRWVFLRADLMQYLREQQQEILAATRRGPEVLKCQSIGEVRSGGFRSPHRLEIAYANRLGLRIEERRKSITTG